MALPTPQKTWIMDVNNRIVYVSLLDTMQRYLYQIKEFLKLNGYTVKGSASAGVGAMDAVDRWTAFTDVTPRATVAAASQAWIVLIDANGVNILITYQGATDDNCRLSLSQDGLFVAAGTPNQQPTATDEVVFANGISVVGSAVTGDRLWNGWVSSDAKHFRFMIHHAGFYIGIAWGVEEFGSAMDAIVTSKPVWGFRMTLGGFPSIHLRNSTSMGTTNSCRFKVAGTPVLGDVRLSVESHPNSGSTQAYSQTWQIIKPELQGSLGYPIWPVTLSCVTSGARGKMGDWKDSWTARDDALPGDTYGTLQFIAITGIAASSTATAGGMWPWDGVTAPILT